MYKFQQSLLFCIFALLNANSKVLTRLFNLHQKFHLLCGDQMNIFFQLFSLIQGIVAVLVRFRLYVLSGDEWPLLYWFSWVMLILMTHADSHESLSRWICSVYSCSWFPFVFVFWIAEVERRAFGKFHFIAWGVCLFTRRVFQILLRSWTLRSDNSETNGLLL